MAVGRSVESPEAVLSGPPSRFETARLRLRPPRVDDAPDVFEYASDPEVTRFLAFRRHEVVGTVEEFLRALTAAAAPDRGTWALTETGSDRLIGMLEIRIRKETFVPDIARGDLGYVLGKRFWGRGYMVEALRLVVDWALSRPSIHRVGAVCDVENTGSWRVLEKLGMRREGILRKWTVLPNVSPIPRDCYSYSIVRE